MQLQIYTDSPTGLSYWLNWRVFLCAIWVFAPMVVALFIIWKYKDCLRETRPQEDNDDDGGQDLCVDDVWRCCLKEIHPAWLLGFRVFAFCFFLATTIVRLLVHGWRIYYYYTQWTFTLVTIFFGLGSFLSIYGCFEQDRKWSKRFTTDQTVTDSENGYHLPLVQGENTSVPKERKISGSREVSRTLNACVHLFQVIFQMSAGAVTLTDCIYWTVIFPFLAIKDYDLNYMTVNLHSSNLVFLLCDTALNRLRFPLFRISYFVLYTGSFVIFQWILHACVSVWWPYPFLDLSSPLAPLWYLVVALMHLPCYGFFALLVKMKHKLLGMWFPNSFVVSSR